MNGSKLRIVILGLSITSSWGNGHASIFRGLLRALVNGGHEVLFLERDRPWYRENRDLPQPPWGRTILYDSVEELKDRFRHEIQDSDLVMIGSCLPDGVEIGTWVVQVATGITAFYDIDTPVTLAKIERGDYEYLTPELIRNYDLYLSFTGGPILSKLEREYGSPMARPFYCCVDPELYFTDRNAVIQWDLGYMGTYSSDRQPSLDRLLSRAAREWEEGRFVVAGPQYPETIQWPPNVHRIQHLPPFHHRQFYQSQKFTLNITRQEMILAGYSPSVRLFEAAACGTPIISDYWDGLDSFFKIGREILVASGPKEVLKILKETPEEERQQIAMRSREVALRSHTCYHRVQELERYHLEAQGMKAGVRL